MRKMGANTAAAANGDCELHISGWRLQVICSQLSFPRIESL